MLRRFVLVGLLVLYQDTIMQLLLGTLLATAFLLFQVHSKGVKRAHARTHACLPPASCTYRSASRRSPSHQ